MTLEIVEVPPFAIGMAEGIEIDMPAVAYLGMDEGAVVGSYGLAWGMGRCWVWFRVTEPKASYALTVIRRAKLLLKKAQQLGEREVFTPRDSQYPTSTKLLKLLGFELYATEHGIEVWRYVWI